MSIWSRIADALSALASGEGLTAVFDQLRTPPEKTVAFTIAVIALSAKMAKADGLVTRDEVMAFREIFHIPREDEDGAARVFNLARQDVAGFEEYAKRIRAMFGQDRGTLCDLMEGLFHIAMADGTYAFSENGNAAFTADSTLYCAAERGIGADNPSDPLNITPLEASRSVFVEINNVAAITTACMRGSAKQ